MHPHAFPHSVGAVSSWQDMQPGLQEVRQHGMARAIDQPIAGVSAFAVPVFDYNGHKRPYRDCPHHHWSDRRF